MSPYGIYFLYLMLQKSNCTRLMIKKDYAMKIINIQLGLLSSLVPSMFNDEIQYLTLTLDRGSGATVKNILKFPGKKFPVCHGGRGVFQGQ